MPKTIYTAKPQKVYAEQFVGATTPDQAGVCRCGLDPNVPTGPPHVHVGEAFFLLHETDMIVASKFRPDVILEVVPLAEFEERFGNVPGEEIIT